MYSVHVQYIVQYLYSIYVYVQYMYKVTTVRRNAYITFDRSRFKKNNFIKKKKILKIFSSLVFQILYSIYSILCIMQYAGCRDSNSWRCDRNLLCFTIE